MREAERELIEDSSEITPGEAARKLYEIWHNYYLGPQTPEDSVVRRKVLGEFYTALSFDANIFLESPVDKGAGDLTQGQFIQLKARVDAESERLLRNKRERESRLSEGTRKKIRRQKAEERRGTDPKRIR